MDQLLQQLRDGDITAQTFFTETEQDWRVLALNRYNKLGHRLQGSADVDDVFQEMVISVFQSVEDYDPERTGMTLKKFVVWRAYTAAKDFVNQQCGAYKGRTSEPPRCPLSAAYIESPRLNSDTEHTLADDILDRRMVVEIDQEWGVDVRAVQALVVKTMVDRVVMNSLLQVGGSLQDICDHIYENDRLCAELNLGTKKKTYGMVRRATKRFVERAACIG